ncbi:hypothetical protein D1007_51328 [Hordeum vulgare]|nr:hypothetical protein D1007_51328 [Hordeum vulgare]
MSAAANSATSPLPSVPDVLVDAEPDEEVPRHDDEDEILLPELVDRVSQQEVEDEYAEEPSSRARFDDTDDEEREENIDSLVLQEYDGDDMPTIEWNRENPNLTPGTVFESMVDYRAIIAFTDLSPDSRIDSLVSCSCSLNTERNGGKRSLVTYPHSTFIFAFVFAHRPPDIVSELQHPASSSAPSPGIILGSRSLSPSTAALRAARNTRPEPPFPAAIPCCQERALDRINGPWNESFQLLYTFKAEVETASPGSVVEIDKHTVKYKLKGKTMENECFGRAFVCFKACLQEFLNGCRPYLAVDVTALNGRWRGQLAAASAVDGHNWLFRVAFGVLEVESEESWIWFLQQLRNIIETQYVGHLILPSLIKALHAKARGLRMKCIRLSTYEAGVTYTDSKNREWTYPVNLATNECRCRQWQIRGKPCIYALHLMTVIGGEDGEVDQYCSEYFSVAKFRAAYAENVHALLGNDQWNIVDPGFKLHSPVLTRPPGRPRKSRIRAGEEGRVKKQHKCKRCGILGHIARRCNNPVDASFGDEEQWAAANAEEHAAAEENATSLEDNAASLENEATEVVACSRIIRGTRQKDLERKKLRLNHHLMRNLKPWLTKLLKL